MRNGSLLLFALVALACLGTVRAGEPSYWEGRSADEVQAAWGQPTKTNRSGRGEKVLVYRLRFFGDRMGRLSLWSDVAVGSSPLRPDGMDDAAYRHALMGGGLAKIDRTQEVIVTQKIKFHVNDDGTIFREEVGRVKWKKKAYFSWIDPDAVCPRGKDPSGPQETR